MVLWSLLLDGIRGALFALTHIFGGSLGLGIIGLSVLVRLALLPWSLKAARRSTAFRESLKALEPRIREVRERYAKDPVKLREAILAEYQRAGINPISGSGLGLMAIQLPLGMALYTVIRTGVAESGFLWIANLARPDVVLSALTAGLSLLLGLTVASGQGSVSPTAMAIIMATVTFIVVFNLSAGVALYWASTTSVGILQNALLRRTSSTAT